MRCDVMLQTPCFWPSRVSEPENTDYGLYVFFSLTVVLELGAAILNRDIYSPWVHENQNLEVWVVALSYQ